MFKTIVKSFFEFIFPKRCFSCNEILAKKQEFICVKCEFNISLTHWKLDNNNKIYNELIKNCSVESAFSSLYYYDESVAKNLIHQLKYKGQQELGVFFSELMIPSISEYHQIKPFTGIVYVPLHPKKKKIRGYNQLEVLANDLAKKLEIPVISQALKTVKYQKSQTTKSQKSRLERRKGVYQMNEKLNSGRYLLIDDVFTSGATISHCVKELQKNENVKICVATVAYTV